MIKKVHDHIDHIDRFWGETVKTVRTVRTKNVRETMRLWDYWDFIMETIPSQNERISRRKVSKSHCKFLLFFSTYDIGVLWACSGWLRNGKHRLRMWSGVWFVLCAELIFWVGTHKVQHSKCHPRHFFTSVIQRRNGKAVSELNLDAMDKEKNPE